MRRKGFTLIELMVVTAIIGLMAAVALPRFAGVSDSAKIANVQGNLMSLRSAISLYHARNDDYPNLMGDGYHNDLSRVRNSSTGEDDGDPFTDFYNRNAMAYTPAEGSKVLRDNRIVFGVRNGNELIGQDTSVYGGWVYDGPEGADGEAQRDGAIRAHLPRGVFGDDSERGINWPEF